jgi:hypothetical protein
MKKKVYLIVATILIIFVVFWNCYFVNIIKTFYYIAEWGIYLFSVPIGYCIVAFFSKSIAKPIKAIIVISLGVLISILLTRNFTSSFIMQKILATLIGALASYILCKNLKTKEV